MWRWLAAIAVLSGTMLCLGPKSVCAQPPRGRDDGDRGSRGDDRGGRDYGRGGRDYGRRGRGDRDSGRGGPGGGFRGFGGFSRGMMGPPGGMTFNVSPMTTFRVSPGGFSPGYVRPSGSSTSSQSSSSSSKGWVTKPHPPVTIPLPEEYRERDLNKDGQLSFHEWREWDRAAMMEFLVLDANGDGFLVPRELVSSGAGGSESASQPAKNGTRMEVVKTSTSSQRSGGRSSSGESQDAQRAGYYFDRLDANHDGSVAGDEWSISRRVKPMLEQAGIDLSKPMSKDQFVDAYVRASSNGGR